MVGVLVRRRGISLAGHFAVPVPLHCCAQRANGEALPQARATLRNPLEIGVTFSTLPATLMLVNVPGVSIGGHAFRPPIRLGSGLKHLLNCSVAAGHTQEAQ